MRASLRKFTIYVLGVCFLCILSTIIAARPTFAAYTKITKSQIQLISDFTLDNKANAGGTITKNYYVFPDTKGAHGGPGTIKVVDRKTCAVTDTTKIGSGYLSGLYNKWGTNYITMIGMGKQTGCYKINNSKLQKASGCSTPPGRSLNYQGTGQGNTDTMNGYVFKTAGFSGGIIGVWTSSGSRVATYQIPSSVVNAEPENISIDGDTGEVYINYAKKQNGKLHSLWYKINSSVFSKYTGKNGSSSPTKCKNSTASSGGSDSSSSAELYPDKPYDPTTDKLEIRDETFKPEISQSTYDGTVDTTFFGTMKDEDGCGVYTTLQFILDIMTMGVGILAVIGIAISGITYLTARENVAKTTKAKRRIYEIIIGLAVYVAIYGLISFLVPQFNPELKACNPLSDEEAATLEAEKEAKRQEAKRQESQQQTEQAHQQYVQQNGTTASHNLMTAAEYYANLLASNGLKYCNSGGKNTWAKANKIGCLNCAEYVSIAAQKAGLMKPGKTIWIGSGKIHGSKDNFVSGKVKITENVNKSVSTLYKAGKLVPGDIVGPQSGTPHTMIFKEYKNGKYYFYSVNSKYSGVSAKTHSFKKSWITNKTYSGSYKIGVIIHPK